MHGGHQVAQKWTRLTGARREPRVAALPPASSRKPPGAAVELSPPRGQSRTASPKAVSAAAIARACRPRLGSEVGGGGGLCGGGRAAGRFRGPARGGLVRGGRA